MSEREGLEGLFGKVREGNGREKKRGKSWRDYEEVREGKGRGRKGS